MAKKRKLPKAKVKKAHQIARAIIRDKKLKRGSPWAIGMAQVQKGGKRKKRKK